MSPPNITLSHPSVSIEYLSLSDFPPPPPAIPQHHPPASLSRLSPQLHPSVIPASLHGITPTCLPSKQGLGQQLLAGLYKLSDTDNRLLITTFHLVSKPDDNELCGESVLETICLFSKPAMSSEIPHHAAAEMGYSGMLATPASGSTGAA